MRPVLAATLLLLTLIVPAQAMAHSASTSYLTIIADGRDLEVKWSIALRDLDDAVGLDLNEDGQITWGELRSRLDEVDRYSLANLSLSGDGAVCVPGKAEHLVDQLGDGAYVVLRFIAQCPHAPASVRVRYGLLFDLDPLHRGLLSLSTGGTPHTAVLSPDRLEADFDSRPDPAQTAASFFGAGVMHLLTGLDHLLFVAMLLVPAALMKRVPGDGAYGHPLPWRMFVETVKVLSAFTLAHALTLTLSVLHLVHFPAPISETGIAVTILVTAIDNIFHVLPSRRWPLAFAFGLIHGLGFANALGPLDLPPIALALALVFFNFGLEAVQIGLAAIVLPIGFLFRDRLIVSRIGVPALSGAVALLAAALIVDRAAGLGLIPL